MGLDIIHNQALGTVLLYNL